MEENIHLRAELEEKKDEIEELKDRVGNLKVQAQSKEVCTYIKLCTRASWIFAILLHSIYSTVVISELTLYVFPKTTG